MLLNRNLIKSVCALLLFAGPVAGVEQKTETVPMRLWCDRPATNRMTSALPIGNGELGALFFGCVECEQILFNEKALWTGSTTSRGAYQKFGDIWIHFDRQEVTKDGILFCRKLDLLSYEAH